MARVTLWGFYQYDSTLFDGIVLPDGMKKDELVNTIMKDSGELYPYHQVPEILKQNIAFWFSRRLFDFDRMYQALRVEYSPIENYDRIENITRNYENSGVDKSSRTLGSSTTSKHTGTDTETATLGSSTTSKHTGTDTETTTHSGADTKETQVSAYNESNYTNRDKETQNFNSTYTKTQNYNSTITNSGSGEDTTKQSYDSTVTNTGSGTDTTQTEYGLKRKEVEETRVHGNIGVTTAQQMIESEMALRLKYDMYKIIGMEFEREFLVQIY